MLTYLLFRVFLTGPVTGAVTGADVAAPVVAQAEKQPVVEKPAASSEAIDPRGETVASPRVAQVRLAEMLGNADAIHLVRARGTKVTFTIAQGDAVVELVITTNRKGEVQTLSIAPATAASSDGLTWLTDEMAGTTAITTLVPDEDGAVTLTTDDGRRYMLIPGRGSGGSDGNQAAASRFAGDFDH